MKRMVPLVLLCAACGAETGGDVRRDVVASAPVEAGGRSYVVTLVRDEPFGHVMAPVTAGGGRPSLDAGPRQPAVRVSGAAAGDLQGALAAFAAACGFAYDDVKDWGAYGDPIWQDPRNMDVVLWTDQCPGLTG